MGYRGKVEEQERARELRARNMTLQDIATELGVSKSSVSLWVRDVDFTPSKRRTGPHRRPHPAHEAKLAQIAQCDADGIVRIGTLGEHAFLVTGVALYAGEGSKTEGEVRFANTNPAMVRFFCLWLRRFFTIDEAACGPRSTSTRVSTSTRPNHTGLWSRAFPVPSSGRPTALRRTRPSAGPSTSSAVPTWPTAVRERTAR
jgi:hypothetical protein